MTSASEYRPLPCMKETIITETIKAAIMPADRLLSTLLRSLQTYAEQQDTLR